MTIELWPHGQRGVDETLAAIKSGETRICITSPTGMGKTRMVAALVQNFLADGKRIILFTNRLMLLDQTTDVFAGFGLYHGVRVRGTEKDDGLNFQIASAQTEISRVQRLKNAKLWQADVVFVDEAHLQSGPEMEALLAKYVEAGAIIIGVTATPLDIGHIYTYLVVAGSLAEGRECGALVPCVQFGPDEPDFKRLKIDSKQDGKDLSSSELKKAFPMKPRLFGRIWEWFEKLNPDHKPTILFAAGVRESIWFAEQFSAKGVPAAHIDGTDIWRDGELRRKDEDARRQVIDDSRTGRIVVLCNRFVLREGVDCPWLAHGIAATTFGSVQSFVQSAGRLLRNHPSLTEVTWQDHGGNWWRHGSINDDRQWNINDTARIVYGRRVAGMRNGTVPEPRHCPQCSRIIRLAKCFVCGFEYQSDKRSRPVLTVDGELIQHTGKIYEPRRINHRHDAIQVWEKMYWRSRAYKKGRTFKQAFALYARENYWAWPDEDNWPLMPLDPDDAFNLVADVPIERIRPPQKGWRQTGQLGMTG